MRIEWSAAHFQRVIRPMSLKIHATIFDKKVVFHLGLVLKLTSKILARTRSSRSSNS